jgi:hypothetical protein
MKTAACGGDTEMKKIISLLLNKANKSTYLPVKKDGRDVIRVSGHLPTAANLRAGKKTKDCKNVYLIFVKSMFDVTHKNSAKLAELVKLIDSNDPAEKKLGETRLNDLIVEIGYDANKGMNYMIIDGNSNYEVRETVKAVTRTLKTSVFVPLEYKQD